MTVENATGRRERAPVNRGIAGGGSARTAASSSAACATEAPRPVRLPASRWPADVPAGPKLDSGLEYPASTRVRVTHRALAGVNADVPLSIVAILLVVLARAAAARALAPRPQPQAELDGRYANAARG